MNDEYVKPMNNSKDLFWNSCLPECTIIISSVISHHLQYTRFMMVRHSFGNLYIAGKPKKLTASQQVI